LDSFSDLWVAKPQSLVLCSLSCIEFFSKTFFFQLE
jgi:hypothetical protein